DPWPKAGPGTLPGAGIPPPWARATWESRVRGPALRCARAAGATYADVILHGDAHLLAPLRRRTGSDPRPRPRPDPDPDPERPRPAREKPLHTRALIAGPDGTRSRVATERFLPHAARAGRTRGHPAR